MQWMSVMKWKSLDMNIECGIHKLVPTLMNEFYVFVEYYEKSIGNKVGFRVGFR